MKRHVRYLWPSSPTPSGVSRLNRGNQLVGVWYEPATGMCWCWVFKRWERWR